MKHHLRIGSLFQFVGAVAALLIASPLWAQEKGEDNNRLEQIYALCDRGDTAACTVGLELIDRAVAAMGAEEHRADKYVTLNKAQSDIRRFSMAACMRDSGYGCYRLAFTKLHGVEGAQLVDLRGTLEKSCELGSPDGCAALAGLDRLSEDSAKLQLSMERSKLACAAKSVNGCHIYAIQLRKSTPPRDAEALIFSQYACDQDLGLACGILAEQYATGEGVAVNEQLAYDLYGKACKLSFPFRACEEQQRLGRKLGIVESN